MTGDRAELQGPIQQTLDGKQLLVETVNCQMYPDVCSRPAEFEVSTLVYDGQAQVPQDVAACPSCAKELTEPDPPEDSDKARRLEQSERLVAQEDSAQ